MKSFDEKGQGKPGVSADACGDSDDASNTDADEDFQADEGETKDAPAGTILIHLTAAPDKLTSPWVAAVAHLYQTIDGQAPQANWGADPHPRLWAQTRTQLLAAPQGADACVMAMNTAHAEAQSALGEECDRVIAERIAHRECEIHLRQGEAATPQDRLWLVSQERHRRESACDDHLMWIELRKKFHPLGTSQLTALFGWSSAAAQQYCKRYRSAWPQILPGFGEKVQALYGTQGAVPKNQSKETR